MRNACRGRVPVGSILVLAALIALVIIPAIGLFVFELDRFQYMQKNLQKACDAATLAGGAKLVSAEVDPTKESQKRIQYKILQGMYAAGDFMQKQHVANIPLQEALIIKYGEAAPENPAARAAVVQTNQCVAWIYPVKADRKTPVDYQGLTNNEARAIRMEAAFKYVPAFIVHAGVKDVPIFAGAVSGEPRIEVVLVLDLSGSMDDSTRVSFVRKMKDLTPTGRAELAQVEATMHPPPPPKPIYPSSFAGCPGSRGGRPPDPSDCILGPEDPGPTVCEQYRWCVEGICRPWNDAFEAYQNAWKGCVRKKAGTQYVNQYIDYRVVADGQLRKVLEDKFALQIGPNGSRVNALRPQSLGLTCEPYAASNSGLQWSGQTTVGGEGDGGTGWTDLVVNLDSAIRTNRLDEYKYPQPTFKGETATSTGHNYETDQFNGKAISGNGLIDPEGYHFLNMAELVEASRKQVPADKYAAWGNWADSTAREWSQYGAVDFNNLQGCAANDAYDKHARNYCQPVATTLDAAKLFVDTLAESGKGIKLGMVGFDTAVCDADTLPGEQNPVDPARYTNVKYLTVAVQNNPGRVIPTVGLVALSYPKQVEQLKGELNQLYSLRATSTDEGLANAIALFKKCSNPNSSPGVKRCIVLFTDGQAEDPDKAKAAAAQCKTEGIALYAVGLNQNQALFPAMQKNLDDMVGAAGGDSRAFITPSGDALRKAFLQIARRLVKLTL